MCKLLGKETFYIGDTSRSLNERVAEHHADSRRKGAKSPMRYHLDDDHEGQETEFKFQISKSCKSSFQREISEAVINKTTGMRKVNLLNYKEEFNRCVIPEITVLKGNRVIEDAREDYGTDFEEDKSLKRGLTAPVRRKRGPQNCQD